MDISSFQKIHFNHKTSTRAEIASSLFCNFIFEKRKQLYSTRKCALRFLIFPHRQTPIEASFISPSHFSDSWFYYIHFSHTFPDFSFVIFLAGKKLAIIYGWGHCSFFPQTDTVIIWFKYSDEKFQINFRCYVRKKCCFPVQSQIVWSFNWNILTTLCSKYTFSLFFFDCKVYFRLYCDS